MAGLLSYVPVDVQGDMRQLYKKGTGLLGEAGAYLSEGTPESTGSIAGDIGQAIPIVGRKARDIATGIPRGFMSVTEPLLPEIANIYNQIEAGARGLPMPEDTTGNYLEEVQQNLTNQFGQFAVPLGDESPTETPIKTPPKKNKLDQEAIDRALAEDAFKRLNDPEVPNDPEDVKIVTGAQKEAAGEGGNVKLDKPENVDQGAWDSFNSEFDLTTIGLSLLATSANGQPLAANLGLAMEAGKLAKTKEADKKEAKEDSKKDKVLARAKIEAQILEIESRIKNAGYVDPVERETDLLKLEKLRQDLAAGRGGKKPDEFSTNDSKGLMDRINTAGITGTELSPDNATHRALTNTIGTSFETTKSLAARGGVNLDKNDESAILNTALKNSFLLGDGMLDFGDPDLSADAIKAVVQNPEAAKAWQDHLNKVTQSYIKQYK